jgi:hypothetical protein
MVTTCTDRFKTKTLSLLSAYCIYVFRFTQTAIIKPMTLLTKAVFSERYELYLHICADELLASKYFWSQLQSHIASSDGITMNGNY